MKTLLRSLLLCLLPLTLAFGAASAPDARDAASAPVSRDEMRSAIQRGLKFLLTAQDRSGWWSTKDHPAVTGLVLTAFNQEPAQTFRAQWPSELAKGYDFILESAQSDGSIHRGSIKNYNTSLCLIALATAGNVKFAPVIARARVFLANSQIDLGERGKIDSPFDGGVGYGSKYQHSDMSNTLVALEAMRKSERVEGVESGQKGTDLNWEAAVNFLQSCQNLPTHNPADWVSQSAADRGGFVYYPGNSMVPEAKDSANGRTALRSYGSMSYAGLLSYVYAHLTPDDPRVVAVLNWLQQNFTTEENPGLGAQGYYYYLLLMSKALVTANVDRLTLADGTKLEWRQEVARKLISLQRPDGSWANAEKRWWESDPIVTTAYAVLALEKVESVASGR